VRGHQGALRGVDGGERVLRDGAGRRGGGNTMVMVRGSSGQWLAAIEVLERSHKVSAVAMSAARSRVSRSRVLSTLFERFISCIILYFFTDS